MAIHAADPFAENIRPTAPLTPAEERNSFHLPPGFEIELFASEPEIRKPLNMAFDAQGRMWVTITEEYPVPVPLDKTGRDAIRILEDTDGDGHADKATTFAGGLDIPIGVYPYQDGAIGCSIPNIWRFHDTNGDGRADTRERLYGPLGWQRDAHGLNSSFTRGYDGWLYITHGFNNDTTVSGRDGHEIHMNSGNTYRIRLDGSRVEHNTWGQVNPFGLCFDSLGNLYSADCHSEPVYQLLRGGYYPSFGKPDDGLGFAPSMIFHDHGSTAISGIAYYEEDEWPEEFRDNIFTGNVMTSRVNRDAITYSGSTPTANARPDFISTDDPWFRPVNIQLGPDGALYIADFYNRIIGHYEVPLNHPGRDRSSGRIWRVYYKGSRGEPPVKRFDISHASVDELIATLAHPNLTRRMLAMNELTDRIGPAAAEPVRRMMRDPQANTFQRRHGLWVLFRLGALDPEILEHAAHDPDRAVRTHAMKVLSETHPWDERAEGLAVAGLSDPDPFVRRAAADAVGQHPNFAHIEPLLERLPQIPPDDTHMRHTVRMALRNQFNEPGNLARWEKLNPPDAAQAAVADVAVAVSSAEAASFLLHYVQHHPLDRDSITRDLRHIARYLPEQESADLVTVARQRFPHDLNLQLALFQSVQAGVEQRGDALSQPLHEWGADLAKGLLDAANDPNPAWQCRPVPGLAASTVPWFRQKRTSADGDKDAIFLCSLPPGGEQLTGTLRSKTFVIPDHLDFFMAGHNGFPDKPDQKKNLIRLRLRPLTKPSRKAFRPETTPPSPTIGTWPNTRARRVTWRW